MTFERFPMQWLKDEPSGPPNLFSGNHSEVERRRRTPRRLWRAWRAWMYLEGQTRDDKAGGFLQKALGWMSSEKAVARDDKAGVSWFRKAAELGDQNAQFNLGVFYGKGRGVEQDYEAAIFWYRKAAEQGDPSAQCNLGVLYGKGLASGAPTAEPSTHPETQRQLPVKVPCLLAPLGREPIS